MRIIGHKGAGEPLNHRTAEPLNRVPLGEPLNR
jgi:hypothetical protein